MAIRSRLSLALVLLVSVAGLNVVTCQTSGDCTTPTGFLPGKSGNCNIDNGAECCVEGQMYETYTCSPPITGDTPAQMTLNSFAKGGDGGAESECDGKFHDNSELVVALSTGWFLQANRCSRNIRINANGKSVSAMVVDRCDSEVGCDSDHAFQPPCRNNVVDASQAVWDELEMDSSIGDTPITWSLD